MGVWYGGDTTPNGRINPSPPAMEGQGGNRDVMRGYGRAEAQPHEGRMHPSVSGRGKALWG